MKNKIKTAGSDERGGVLLSSEITSDFTNVHFGINIKVSASAMHHAAKVAN